MKVISNLKTKVMSKLITGHWGNTRLFELAHPHVNKSYGIGADKEWH